MLKRVLIYPSLAAGAHDAYTFSRLACTITTGHSAW
jgi:hypothetical protein